eukprot:3549770-Prymnesium_polylepis.1
MVMRSSTKTIVASAPAVSMPTARSKTVASVSNGAGSSEGSDELSEEGFSTLCCRASPDGQPLVVAVLRAIETSSTSVRR